ncbi:MAG: pentapeptide repeat-containing protein [Alphaproteobacteria bacterium]|nr:pentapeptide repeat-containing protein [Alphaproteobacteria bacterium]
MTTQIKRPEKKFQDVKVTEEDIALFTLGIDKKEFLLPSERKSYLTDPRAVSLVEDIKAGKIVSNKDYRGINLKGADISGADFTGCDFSRACFFETNASDCCFKGAKFNDAYIESTDLTNAIFEDVSLKRVFLRNNQVDETYFDEKAQKYFSDFDKFLSLVESGKIDIRTLTKSELMSVDIRRIDLTKVDLLGIDLSQFSLDGVNLCGTYIDPKQLLSLGSLQKRYYDLRRTKDKKRKQMEEALLQEKEEALRLFGLRQEKERVQAIIVPKKPSKKEVLPDGYVLWPKGQIEETKPEGFEATIVETPVEVMPIVVGQQQESSLEEINTRGETAKKIISKPREMQKTNTKTKG